MLNMLDTILGDSCHGTFSLVLISRQVQLLAVFFLFLSSILNPFIYTCTNRAFKREFLKIMFALKINLKQPNQRGG